MRAINPAGLAAALTPGDYATDGTYTVDLLLMEGDIPAQELLKPLLTKAQLTTSFPNVVKEFAGLSLETKFNFGRQERTFKKVPVDALPFTNGQDGKIGWAAIVFDNGRIMFTDGIGGWNDVDKEITLDKIDPIANGQENILKDINIVVRDKSTYETNPNGIF